jgi:hypothetical protein
LDKYSCKFINSKNYLNGSGTQTLALAFGGRLPPNTVSAATEEWTGAGLQQQLQSQLLNPLLIHLINVERVKK